MQTLLVKKNIKTTDYVLIEHDKEYVYLKWGKIGKPNKSKSTTYWGSLKEVLKEIEKITQEYVQKGYTISNSKEINIIDFEVFDKAKWHLEGDFPIDLKAHQAYVLTGMFVAWLVVNNLISDELIVSEHKSISSLIKRKSKPVAFFENQMDGVFTTNDVNEIGYKFSKKYFDFDSGLYLSDYESVLTTNLPSMFHVKDTWENFDILAKQITFRFKEWKDTNLV